MKNNHNSHLALSHRPTLLTFTPQNVERQIALLKALPDPVKINLWPLLRRILANGEKIVYKICLTRNLKYFLPCRSSHSPPSPPGTAWFLTGAWISITLRRV
jgi:hypothetical protein